MNGTISMLLYYIITDEPVISLLSPDVRADPLKTKEPRQRGVVISLIVSAATSGRREQIVPGAECAIRIGGVVEAGLLRKGDSVTERRHFKQELVDLILHLS